MAKTKTLIVPAPPPDSPDRMVMHPHFLFFPAEVVAGDPVQIEMEWLENAGALSWRKFGGSTATLRIMELALPVDDLDFHLSFKAEANYAKDAHFCIRRDALGQNACLYWFYQLVRAPDGSLSWSWRGCSGQGDAANLARYRTPGVVYGTTAGNVLNDLLKGLLGKNHVLEKTRHGWTLRGP